MCLYLPTYLLFNAVKFKIFKVLRNNFGIGFIVLLIVFGCKTIMIEIG